MKVIRIPEPRSYTKNDQSRMHLDNGKDGVVDPDFELSLTMAGTEDSFLRDYGRQQKEERDRRR